MDKWLKYFKHVITGNSHAVDRKKMMRQLMLIGGVGVLLMLLPTIWNSTFPSGESQHALPVSSSVSKPTLNDSQSNLERRLTHIIERLPHVGQVEVMIVLDGSEQLVVQQNEQRNRQVTEEQSRNGETRQTQELTNERQTVLQQSAGNQQPVVVQTIEPKIRGVIVVAEGAENAAVKKMIVEAVRRGLDVRLSAISILPFENK